MKRLEKTKRIWSELGVRDPLWAIKAHSDKTHNRWDIQEFYETGIKDTNELILYLESLDLDIPKQRCLDFACGVGRMSNALGDYFEELYGVDISLPMIEKAQRYIDRTNCYFQTIASDDLQIFPDSYFDLIVSYLTLFHIHSENAKNYLREFMRILNHQGSTVFHLVNEPIIQDVKTFITIKLPQLSRLLWRVLGRYPSISMYAIYCIPDEDVNRLVENNAGKILDRLYLEETLGRDYICNRYCVVKT